MYDGEGVGTILILQLTSVWLIKTISANIYLK